MASGRKDLAALLPAGAGVTMLIAGKFPYHGQYGSYLSPQFGLTVALAPAVNPAHASILSSSEVFAKAQTALEGYVSVLCASPTVALGQDALTESAPYRHFVYPWAVSVSLVSHSLPSSNFVNTAARSWLH